MTELALDAVLEPERVFLLPLFGVSGCGMAAQADGRFLRLLSDAAEVGYLLSIRLGQGSVGLGVSGHAPETELVSLSPALVTTGTDLYPHVNGMLLRRRTQERSC
jgi:hypothetical protein